jgi:Caspase domain
VYPLKGAVDDALAVKQYLEDRLGVPESQIRLLRDAEATRAAIIQEFNDLAADQRIHRGDPILVYYAGHGGEADAPKDWAARNGKIQMLIPHDFRIEVDGQKTFGIPIRRTIGALLSRVAEKQGDNIVRHPKLHNNAPVILMGVSAQTIILDCCLSGTGTGSESGSTRYMRSEIPNSVPSDLDLRIWSDAQHETSGVAIVSGFLQHRRRSYVFLSACQAGGVAYERHGKGAFTTALLDLLSRVDAEKVTYANLLQRLPSLPE